MTQNVTTGLAPLVPGGTHPLGSAGARGSTQAPGEGASAQDDLFGRVGRFVTETFGTAAPAVLARYDTGRLAERVTTSLPDVMTALQSIGRNPELDASMQTARDRFAESQARLSQFTVAGARGGVSVQGASAAPGATYHQLLADRREAAGALLDQTVQAAHWTLQQVEGRLADRNEGLPSIAGRADVGRLIAEFRPPDQATADAFSKQVADEVVVAASRLDLVGARLQQAQFRYEQSASADNAQQVQQLNAEYEALYRWMDQAITAIEARTGETLAQNVEPSTKGRSASRRVAGSRNAEDIDRLRGAARELAQTGESDMLESMRSAIRDALVFGTRFAQRTTERMIESSKRAREQGKVDRERAYVQSAEQRQSAYEQAVEAARQRSLQQRQ